jgi:hypothetical protein
MRYTIIDKIQFWWLVSLCWTRKKIVVVMLFSLTCGLLIGLLLGVWITSLISFPIIAPVAPG